MINMPLIILLKKFCNSKYNLLLNKISFQSSSLVSKSPRCYWSYLSCTLDRSLLLDQCFQKIRKLKKKKKDSGIQSEFFCLVVNQSEIEFSGVGNTGVRCIASQWLESCKQVCLQTSMDSKFSSPSIKAGNRDGVLTKLLIFTLNY